MLEKVHGVKSLEDIGFTPDMKEKQQELHHISVTVSHL